MIHKKLLYIFHLFLFLAPPMTGMCGPETNRTITWRGTVPYEISATESVMTPYFEGAGFDPQNFGFLPVYTESIRLDEDYATVQVQLTDIQYEEAGEVVTGVLETLTSMGMASVGDDFHVIANIAHERKQPYLYLTLLPLRMNALTGHYEKLLSFGITIIPGVHSRRENVVHTYADNSVLRDGNWIKIKVAQSGLYRITYNDLENYGLDPATVDPHELRLYGNRAGLLPESNFEYSYDDLSQIAIQVAGEEDGSFDPSDYILFFGESPVQWIYNPFRDKFEHQAQLYDSYTYYFLTDHDTGSPAKRIGQIASTTLPATDTAEDFNDFACYEADLVNLIKSGKEWYGKKYMQGDNSETISFHFTDIDTSSMVYAKLVVAGKSTTSNSFSLSSGGTNILDAQISGIATSSTTIYARKATAAGYFNVFGPDFNLVVTYDVPTATSLGWLNYLEVNVRRHLTFSGGQTLFRDVTSTGRDKVCEFILNHANSQVNIWEVTDPLNISEVSTTLDGDELHFRLPTDSLRHFIAFDGTLFYSPVMAGKVTNQNLHGQQPVDMVIITASAFLDQAEKLATLHRDHDGLTVTVVTPEQVYNEFSSGAQDISALRNFMRMLYERVAAGEEPRYLLLFGDGSYDPKDRLPGNTNLIPTFQSKESLILTSSFVTDDFFGLYDPDEGNNAMGSVDIGIGRLPAKSPEEAAIIVDKIKHYMSNTSQVMGNWRNMVCFAADDEDNNLHFNQAEELAGYVADNYKTININKIYYDAYTQVSTPGGPRYPGAKADLNACINNGLLIMNYTGHGGEEGWSNEKVLEMQDIMHWTNYDKLPFFVTATCEFSRFDDPARTSAGEEVFLNPSGGGIALITTTRLAFAQSNFTLNQRFYTHVFEKTDGKYWRMGDLIMLSKNPANDNLRNVVLLGDPALRLSYPSFNVVTTAFNNRALTDAADTIRALTKVTVKGAVVDDNGNTQTNFNGIVYPVVYDKTSVCSTLGNDPKSIPDTFLIQKDILFKGQATVVNGTFTFTFKVPQDIAYNYGFGKISYYATDGTTDAGGYFNNFVIGGMDASAGGDLQGPEITLYLNDTIFTPGSLVNENPILLAFMCDSSGINANGNGIGHDIVAYLDNDPNNLFVLNNYFEFGLDNYRCGSLAYPLYDLDDGPHTVTLKAWDLMNNSSTVTTDFIVSRSITLGLSHLYNYPNPVTEGTSFTFDDNQFNAELKVEIRVFNILGKLVKTIGPLTVLSQGYHAPPITWDGNGDNGQRLGRGMYLYSVTVDNNKNSIQTLSGKLIILK